MRLVIPGLEPTDVSAWANLSRASGALMWHRFPLCPSWLWSHHYAEHKELAHFSAKAKLLLLKKAGSLFCYHPAKLQGAESMRILVVGAGAIGGYFGGRLLEAKQDVTFLVRPRRAAELAESGLNIRSRFGDATIPSPPTVLAENLRETFDLVLLSVKAFDLESAIESFAPAIGPNTGILPLLNGMRHLDILDNRFRRGQSAWWAMPDCRYCRNKRPDHPPQRDA